MSIDNREEKKEKITEKKEERPFSLEENYKGFIFKLKDKCKDLNRKFDDINLVAVSKTKSLDLVKEAFRLGVRDFGENYVSEIVEKYEKEERRSFFLRMIGHLQTNKVRQVIDYVDSIDSIDSFHLASKLSNALAEKNEEEDKRMEVLFEVSSCDDVNKTGFKNVDEIKRTLDFVLNDENMIFKGFMTVGALSEDESLVRKSFEKFLTVIRNVENEYPECRGLYRSFGMTGDWQIALEMGSNMLRIGRAIFGQR